MTSLLPCCVILTMVLTVSHGCSCRPYPDKRPLYCRSDFVIRATILGRQGPLVPESIHEDPPIDFLNDYGSYRYQLDTLDEIRVTKSYLNRTESTILAYKGPMLCGVLLNVSSTYILSGKVAKIVPLWSSNPNENFKTEMSTSLCDYPEVISPDEDLPNELKNLKCV